MKRMNWLLGLMATFSLAMIAEGKGSCPPGNIFSYHKGEWCCATPKEKDCDNLGPECDGSLFNPNSTCCEADNFVRCKTPPCMNFRKGLCYSKEMNFPCIITEKTGGKAGVHALTLGDIDVIAGLGGSIFSGRNALNRIYPENPFTTDYPYATFVMGGDPNYASIANYIKEYNKDLIGFSTKDDNGYNFAVAGASTVHLKAQANKMIKELKKHEHLTKMVNILIGNNDFCSESCLAGFKVQSMVSRVMEVIRLIKAKLPNTFLNIIAPIDTVPSLYYFNKHGSSYPLCKPYVTRTCPCLFNDTVKITPNEMHKLETEYYQELVKAIEQGRYDTKYFAVVTHSMGMTVNLPYPEELFATDCLHGAELAQKHFAVEMFNSLFEDVEARPRTVTFPAALKCPEKERPFLRTSLNSRSGERGVLYGMDTMFDPTKVNCQ